ncbi:MAG: hypothetical protein JWN30_1217 [Bacilli bacterium]|nr:hypothetical protein [Bacilli bacterium]
MHKQLENLIEIIERIIDEYNQLLTLGEAHKQALIKGDTTALDQVLKRISQSMRRINRLEVLRQEVGQEIAAQFSVEPEQITTSYLVQHSDAKTGERIQQLSNQCRDVVNQIQVVNQQNSELTEQSLSYVQEMIDLFMAMNDNGSYGKDAAGYGIKAPMAPASNGGHLFDFKA